VSYRIIKDREEVTNKARHKIDVLMSKIKNMTKGAESEYLFHMVCYYQNEFASRAETPRRATGWLTLALNEMLPKFLPLKLPIERDVRQFEKKHGKNLRDLIKSLIEIGKWRDVLENVHVKTIIVEDGVRKPCCSEDEASAFQEYVNKATIDKEQARWFDYLRRKIRGDYEFKKKLDEDLRQYHGFRLEDLVNASSYLEDKAKNNVDIIPGNEIRAMFTTNIRSDRADKLLKELAFGEGKDLCKSPLIPLRKGGFLIARWVFSLKMHFNWLLMPMIESTNFHGEYGRVIGNTFESYIREIIEPVADATHSKVLITEREFPEIRPWLDKLSKKEKFEIDVIAIKSRFAFVVSCKGGKKELPKLRVSKMLSEFLEREIVNKIKENKNYIEEINIECKCIESNKRIAKHLGVLGKELVPVVAHSTVQPLSMSKVRELYGVPPNVKVMTPKELKDLVAGTNFPFP